MKAMTLERARAIVAETVRARKQWGKYGQPTCSTDEVLDALVVMHDSANLDAPTPAEVTLLRRQLAACQNREKARQNKDLTGTSDPDPGHSAD